MDQFHQLLGTVGGYILASDDTIRRSRNFSNRGKVYKGYQIIRNNSIVDLVSPKESEYINVELSDTLSSKLENSLNEQRVTQLHSEYQNELNQQISVEEAFDMHIRKNLPDIEDKETKSILDELKEIITDPNVRIDWVTYRDTSLLDGFIIYTRLFPDSISLESYDSAVNSISHYGPKIDEGFSDNFGEFVKEFQDEGEKMPTGGSEGEQEPDIPEKGFA